MCHVSSPSCSAADGGIGGVWWSDMAIRILKKMKKEKDQGLETCCVSSPSCWCWCSCGCWCCCCWLVVAAAATIATGACAVAGTVTVAVDCCYGPCKSSLPVIKISKKNKES